jgi:hypothetical protein
MVFRCSRGGFDMEDRGMTTRSNRRRAERTLADFRRRLESLDADEIRLMLERRRVRSAERIALAKQRLAELEQTAEVPPTAAARPPAKLRTAPAGPGIAPAPGVKGRDQADQKRPAEADSAFAAGATVAGRGMLPGREVGRILRVGLGLASIAALALFMGRR